MISHKHKFIFIHIPKTGGHSVDKFFLNKNMVDDTKWHCTGNQIFNFLGEDKWQQYKTFTIVRNPWDRMVSEYSWQAQTGENQIATPWGNKEVTFKQFLKMVSKSPTDHHDMNSIRSFDTWYRHQEIKDGHLNEQYKFVIDSTGKTIIDNIIKFENLNEGFRNMLSCIGMPAEDLPHLNKSKHKHYTEYYDQECIDMIHDRFRGDIDKFDYKFG